MLSIVLTEQMGYQNTEWIVQKYGLDKMVIILNVTLDSSSSSNNNNNIINNNNNNVNNSNAIALMLPDIAIYHSIDRTKSLGLSSRLDFEIKIIILRSNLHVLLQSSRILNLPVPTLQSQTHKKVPWH